MGCGWMSCRGVIEYMTETLSAVLPDEVEQMTRALLEEASKRELTLATAESCTGGLLGSLLTDVVGASHVFERGFIAYSEQAKCDLLGIAAETIDRCGAVSREVAIAMAEGAIRESQADIALAITGFAGHGGDGDEPGLVHFACARRGGEVLHREKHFGDIGRGPVRVACMRTAVEMMGEALG